jgi:hypothetical protein
MLRVRWKTMRLSGLLWLAVLLLGAASWSGLPGFGQGSSSLVETGKVSVAGRDVPYRLRNLPISSYPELPVSVAEALAARGCVIPQTYEAKRPENVVHASLERPGSSDWAVLCATNGKVSLLVFLASGSPAKPMVLVAVAETDRLQAHDPSGELGFNWGIDPASPKRIHDAQAGMIHRPMPPDHDSLADTTVDHQTIYHLYKDDVWVKVEVE